MSKLTIYDRVVRLLEEALVAAHTSGVAGTEPPGHDDAARLTWAIVSETAKERAR